MNPTHDEWHDDDIEELLAWLDDLKSEPFKPHIETVKVKKPVSPGQAIYADDIVSEESDDKR